MTAGDIYTVAGNGSTGFSGRRRPGHRGRARPNPKAWPQTRPGNVLIADTDNNRIRVVAASTGTFYGQAMNAGDIYTVAGNGSYGISGDGGPATEAELQIPAGVAVDAAGNLLIADAGNNRIRVVAASTGTFYGQPMTAGDIYTIAGNGERRLLRRRRPGHRGRAQFPRRRGRRHSGNVLIADTINSRIRVVAASTGTFYGQPMTAGDIYTIAGDGTDGYSGDGGPATAAKLYAPAVAVDGAGNLVIADTEQQPGPGGRGQHRHLLRAADDRRGHLHHRRGRHRAGISGDGGPATSAELDFPPAVSRSTPRATWSSPTVQQPHPGRGGQHRDLLRAGDDRRGHLHHRRERHRRVLRRRRPRHHSRARQPRSGGCRCRQRVDR